MSGERPSPLWPEGLRKKHNLPPVENQRTQPPASGDTSSVPKQEAGSGEKKLDNLNRSQNATAGHVGSRIERQGNQDSNAVLPAYLSGILRETSTRWLRPDKEVLAKKGWDTFAEYAVDKADFLPKPENPSIPKWDIDARDEDALDREHMDANAWEKEVVTTLEEDGFGHLVEGFRQDMRDYRASVKAIVQLWKEKGLL
jgi:hypothetical protein